MDRQAFLKMTARLVKFNQEFFSKKVPQSKRRGVVRLENTIAETQIISGAAKCKFMRFFEAFDGHLIDGSGDDC